MVRVLAPQGPSVAPSGQGLPSPQTVRQSAAGASPEAFGSATGRAQQGAGQDVSKISEHVSNAALKIQMRKNARKRMKAYMGYQSEAADLYRGFLETGDLTDDAQVQAYNQQLNSIRDRYVGEHDGGPLSSLDLDNQLVEAQSGYSSKMNEEVFKAHVALEDEAIDTLSSELAAKASIEPRTVMDLISYGDSVIENNWADALPPQKMQLWRRQVRAAAFKGAINNFLAARDHEAVYDLFEQNPDLGVILGDEAPPLLRQARAIEMGTDKADTNVDLHLDMREKMAGKIGDLAAEQVFAKVDAGQRAFTRLANIEAQNNLIDTGLIVPGPAFELRTGIAAIGKFFGASSETLVRLRLGDPDAARAFQAKMHEQTVEIVQGGSRITNMFIEEVRGQMAKLWYTPGGIAVIQEMRGRIAEFEIAEAQVAEKYIGAQDLGPIEGDEDNSPGYFTELRELKKQHQLEWDEAEIRQRIDEATAEAPNNWGEAMQILREGMTSKVNPAMPMLTEQIQGAGMTDEQAFMALQKIGAQIGQEVKLVGVQEDGKAIFQIPGRTKLSRTPVPLIEYLDQPDEEPGLGETEVENSEVSPGEDGQEEAPDESSNPDPF